MMSSIRSGNLPAGQRCATALTIFSTMVQLTPDHSIYETAVPPAWIGKTIGQLGVRQRHNINILATKQGEELTPIPGGEYCFRGDETILILGDNRDVQKFLHF